MKNKIQKILNNYLDIYPQDAGQLAILKRQLSANQDITSRKNFEGHVTASGLVLSPDSSKVLLIFHNKLEIFLQPGGHMEPEDTDLFESVKREVKEETGLLNFSLIPWCVSNDSPICVDSHIIPHNPTKNEPEHYHHDFMFVFRSSLESVVLQHEEVSDFKWTPIEIIMKEDTLISKVLKRLKENKVI